jgi:hypothetical protein
MSQGQDYTAEILDGFRRYCQDGTVPVLSDDALGYLRHCLAKAARHAAMFREEAGIGHHQFFVLMAIEVGHPERIADFLIAVAQDQEDMP